MTKKTEGGQAELQRVSYIFNLGPGRLYDCLFCFVEQSPTAARLQVQSQVAETFFAQQLQRISLLPRDL